MPRLAEELRRAAEPRLAAAPREVRAEEEAREDDAERREAVLPLGALLSAEADFCRLPAESGAAQQTGVEVMSPSPRQRESRGKAPGRCRLIFLLTR